ncbi:ATPase, V1/A1 complex, subunit E [Saitoella complicata NRRL Y-17804]|nr:ATPase, V1/A1 complex, subunit E [Saitoella complicata NRRL Y-17804]ODQ56227.1 ATPase, V1/A1 complex, subunit E [Saitoella complicata NRRL Y-17804]
MSLSDDQVNQEMKKMIAFIKQEAMEKAREIHIKADEEFAIEKAKLVRQETSNIDATYERKKKQAAMQQQISKSLITNKTRLRTLAARQEVLDTIFEDARNELKNVSKDKTMYEELLKGLLLQGLYSLMEKEVEVRVRDADKDVVKKAIEKAVKDFNEQAGFEPSVSIDEEGALPSESSGGMVIVGLSGRIEVDNTLEERLRLLEDDALPAIRIALFG